MVDDVVGHLRQAVHVRFAGAVKMHVRHELVDLVLVDGAARGIVVRDLVTGAMEKHSGDAVLMSAADFDSWQETIYLLRSPANARRLMEAVGRDRAGETGVTRTLEELRALAGE